MTTSNYKRADSIEFAKKVSRKIKGWYDSDTYHDNAVDRIVLQREEIYSLLEKVEKVSVKKTAEVFRFEWFLLSPIIT